MNPRLMVVPLLLLARALFAQSEISGQVSFAIVDAVIEQAIHDRQIPGAVLLVGHKGKVVYRKAYGWRALEPAREPMTEDTIFDIASLTKPLVTATCIMELVRVGKVRLNDPIAEYIPEFGRNGKHGITVRQLLTHFSGLRPDLDLNTAWIGRDAALRLIANEVPIHPPGSTFVYSDINFEMLGYLVERLAGVPLEEYAQRVVFTPLQMRETRFLPPVAWKERIAPTEYDEQGRMLRGVVDDPTARRIGGVAGHAGVFSTADDLGRFAEALLDRKKILSPSSIEKMTTPQQPPWSTVLRGLGWDIDSPLASNRGELLPVGSFGHTGFTGTSMWIDPYTETYFVFLTNALHPRATGNPWAKISLRTKLANAITTALGNEIDDTAQAKLVRITGYNEAAAAMRRPVARNGRVLNGIDVIANTGFAALKGKRIAVLTNQTGVDRNGVRTIGLLKKAPGVKLIAILSPEHGVAGSLDTTGIPNTTDASTGLPVFSLYGTSEESRRPSPQALANVDSIVVDLQDVGVRFYTYVATLLNVMEEAAKRDIEVIVLDRPNPLGGTFVQGPVSDIERSFVNPHRLPVRHGMTIGEMAKLLAAENRIKVRLTVVTMQGWQRGDWFDSTGQIWINPSPNMRSLTAATLYPGVGMIEFSNISVGRGTDRPFELVGAPWISQVKARELADHLNGRRLAGVRFIPVTFTPASGPFARQPCAGVNLIVTDRDQLDSPELGIELAAALLRLFPSDYRLQRTLALVGHQTTMKMLEAGTDPRQIADGWRDDIEQFEAIRKEYLLYP